MKKSSRVLSLAVVGLAPGSYFFVPAALKHKTICKSGADHCLFLDQSPGAFDIKIVEATATKK